MDIKRILPLLVLIIFIAIIGVTMISAVRSEEKKAQKAWDEVLMEDRETASAARQALALVDRLEQVLMEHPEGTPEAAKLEAELVATWPNFDRKDASGEVDLPTFANMRRQLNFYINRG